MTQTEPTGKSWLPSDQLQRLFDAIQQRGFQVVGPTVRDEAIVYDKISRVDQLPQGWTDTQGPATYQISEGNQDRKFYYNSLPTSWKQFLYPARQELSGATLTNEGWQFASKIQPPPKLALLGARACDLAAIAIQDRVFLDGEYVDPVYAPRRQSVLIIAVNCSTASSTCFCTSMNTGPDCRSGFDIALTETDTGFLVQFGSESGAEIIGELNLSPATASQSKLAASEVQNARDAVTKNLNTDDVHDLLLDNLEHPHWQSVADRCLSCSNCTMVCPTCFCATVSEVSDLEQTDVTRVRQWDSCFNPDFSYTASGTVRDTTRSRYRQWLTHKLATWQDQFDTSGCTGCGRCIAWCPVGIDLTEEVAAIRKTETTNHEPL